jgi:hypothetical protein
MKGTEYYTIVGFGSHPKPARGPFNSIDKADDAVDRFRSKYGYKAGEYLSAGSVRLIGPFDTRAAAARASINTGKGTVRHYNPGGSKTTARKRVSLKNFTGTITKNKNGTVTVRGKGKRK